MKIADDIKDDPVLKQLINNIQVNELFLLNHRMDLTEVAIARQNEKLKMLRFNYNKYVEKKYINKNRIKDLYVPGLQPEDEKNRLLELIDSV